MHHNRMDDKSGVQCIEVHKKREQGGARSVCPPGLSSVELIALPSSPSHTLCSLEMSVFPENWTASLSILHFSSRLAKTPKKEFYPNFPFDTLMNVKKVDTSWLGASRRLTFELGQSQSSAYILLKPVKSNLIRGSSLWSVKACRTLRKCLYILSLCKKLPILASGSIEFPQREKAIKLHSPHLDNITAAVHNGLLSQ